MEIVKMFTELQKDIFITFLEREIKKEKGYQDMFYHDDAFKTIGTIAIRIFEYLNPIDEIKDQSVFSEAAKEEIKAIEIPHLKLDKIILYKIIQLLEDKQHEPAR
jgi:hypothetical protein